MSLSANPNACFQCRQSVSGRMMNGWRLRNGQFAQLCNLCGILFEEGKLCDVFHQHQDGWRKCESCEMAIHCGCIVSFKLFMPSDSCGIICRKCLEHSFIMARRSNQLVAATPSPSLVDAIQEEIKTTVKICASSVVIPLFEKQLSAVDADQRLGRLVIPTQSAEAFFPKISEPGGGCRLKFLDTNGKEWEFGFGYWLSGGNKVYALEGLKEFMILKQWQAVDVVTFYRIEPEKKFIIDLIKSAANQPTISQVNLE